VAPFYNLQMEYTTGFFQLRGPQDLLDKLRHDYRRLNDNPQDAYAAFDFFVTASHMHEWWLRYGAKWEPPTDPKEAAIFRLCGEVGNGAKHFVLENKIKSHEVRHGGFAAGTFDAHAFDVGDLVLQLPPADAALFETETVTVLRLAASVLTYWEADMHKRLFPLKMT